MRRPERIDGYAPIEDYALIGDGRSLGLVALDGSLDWLCLPDLDAPAVFSGLLDPERGGSFYLRPRGEFLARRRYIDETNILEQIYTTDTGTVRVTEAFLMDGGALLPWCELVRKIEGIEGEVELEWRLAARPRWGTEEANARIEDNVALVEWDGDAIAVLSYDCGEVKVDGADLHGRFTVDGTEKAILAMLYFNDAPLGLPPRGELEARLARTRDYWQSYTREIPYDGPWLAEVRRSVLVQRVLTYPPTGAIAAAPTSSLPEKIGGKRNWDYRFSWLRDTSLALESLLAVRLTVECQRSLDWVVSATRQGDGVKPLYTLRGTTDVPNLELDLAGYLGSKPVHVGNGAVSQLQLGGYGYVIDAAYRFCDAGNMLDPDSAKRCVELANDVCELWQKEDAGIWEISPRQYTESKISCWGALEHALRLADSGRIPDDDTGRWQDTQKEIRGWVEEHGWSEERGAYMMWPGSDELDAAILLGQRFGYFEPGNERFRSTVEAIQRELGRGPFLYRTTGLIDNEGCFLACSFWLVSALARDGRLDEARSLMEELLAAANDVGLYAEEIDPETRGHRGNFPQTLTHLSLILAAVAVMRAERDAV